MIMDVFLLSDAKACLLQTEVIFFLLQWDFLNLHSVCIDEVKEIKREG